MRFRKFFLAVAFLLIWLRPGFAADLSIETSVSSSRVEVGGRITLDLIISNAPGKIATPAIGALDGFTAYSQGHSQEISIINGQMSSRSIFTYVLVANETGKKTIGPFEVTIDGKKFKVAPVQVEVVAGSPGIPQNAALPSGAVSSSPRAAPSGDVSDKDIFVQAWTDKDEVYVNEPVMLTYTFYTRMPATYKGFEKEPVTTGFWIEDFPPEKTIRRQEKIVNGSRYVVADVRKMALFPTEAGVFTLDPGVLSADVEIRQNDPFDDFFSNNIFGARRAFTMPALSQIVSKKLSLSPITITVKTLPSEGRPENFGGAVGSYLMEGSVDKNEVQTGDPVTYRLRIWGRGNINTLQMPAFPKLDDFKIYDSSSSSQVTKDKLIVEGEKIAETVIVPKKPGRYTIPPVSFSYFDLGDQSYRMMKTDPQTLTVTGAAVSAEEPAAGVSGIEPQEKQDVSVLSQDIRFIKTAETPRSIGGFNFYEKPFFWVLCALFFAGWLGFAFFSSAPKMDALASLKDMKFRRSHAVARQKLRDAKRFLREEKQDEFYAEISRVVYGYFGDKLGVSPQAVSLPVIEARTGEELGGELFGNIKKLFDELSAGRYARSSRSLEDMRDLYGLADRVITFFERVKMK